MAPTSAHNGSGDVEVSPTLTPLTHRHSADITSSPIKTKLRTTIAAKATRATYQATYKFSRSNAQLALSIVGLIVLWYIISLLLTAGNKILLDSLAFPYPLAVTFIHFSGVALIIRTVVSYCIGPRSALVVDPQTYVSVILPIAFFSAVEIALGNQAYSMVSLSVMTVVKSTLVAATYGASIVAGLEIFRVRLAAVLLWIILSVAVSVPGMEIQNSFGVVVLTLAVICAAVRWVLVHKQLASTKKGSLDLISITQPLAALCLLPAAVVYDLPDLLSNLASEPTDSQRVCAILLLLVFAVLLASVLLFCEFKLIELTSSLTLTVAGVGKEVLTIGMSMVLFKERLQLRAIVGLISSLAGITVYAYIRHGLNSGTTKDNTGGSEGVELPTWGSAANTAINMKQQGGERVDALEDQQQQQPQIAVV